MNPLKSIVPSFFTHPTGHLPATDEHVKQSARPSGPSAAQTHLQSIPSYISRGTRPPIKVGSFKVPKGLSKNRFAALLKPLGPVTELDTDNSRGSSDDGETCYSYRAQDPADGSDEPAREVEVRIQVHSNGQLKQLIASLHPERGHEAQLDGIEVDFHQPQLPNQPLDNVQRTRHQRAAQPHDQVKAAQQKLAERTKEIKEVVEEQQKRNEQIAALDITY